MRSAFATDGPGPQLDASNKFRSMRIALSAMTFGADVNLSPSSLSDARSKNRRRSTAALNGSRPTVRVIQTLRVGRRRSLRTFPTPRGVTLRTADARIRALRAARRPEAGALERATPKNNFTPADVRARAEGL